MERRYLVMKQRLLVAFLAAQMLFTQFPMDTVGAAELNEVAGTQTVASETENTFDLIEDADFNHQTPASDFTWSGTKIVKYKGKSKNVVIPSKATAIGDSAFENNKSVVSVTIPTSVTSIGEKAFSNCDALKKMVIPSKVTKIDSMAFYSCGSLSYFEIKSAVLKKAGMYIFTGCENLKEIKLTGKLKEIPDYLFDNADCLEKVSIPGTVTRIGQCAFANCDSLKSISLPANLTEIAGIAFDGCKSLKSVVIPSKVKTIGYAAFSGCSGLTSFEINSGVLEKTSSFIFYGCKNLKEVKLNGALKKIPEDMFANASYLEKVIIPKSVTSIDSMSFYECNSLKSIVIPENVTYIGYAAFKGCAQLKSVVVPAKVNEIDWYAFENCTALTGVTVKNKNVKFGVKVFRNDNNLTIKCYKNSTAHKYALDNKIKCDPTLGNSSGNTVTANAVKGLKIGGRASNALRLNWNSDSSVKGYIIEQYSGGKWVRIARLDNNKTNTYRIAGLSASSTYKFRVKTFVFSGKKAVYSQYAYINGKTNPRNITGLRIGGTAKDALRLNWNRNSGANGYIVERYNGKKWVRVKKITSNNTTTLRVEKLASKKNYKFRVKAYSFDGNTPLYSGYSYINGTTK